MTRPGDQCPDRQSLGLSPRTGRDLIAGWLEVADAARKTRRYHLSADTRSKQTTNLCLSSCLRSNGFIARRLALNLARATG